MEKEHDVTVNGHKLNTAQIMTLRAALNNFTMDLKEGILGEDILGKGNAKGYLDNIQEIFQMFQVSKVDKIKVHRQIRALPGVVTEPLDPNRVIAQAYEEMKEVILIGRDHDEQYYFASSIPDGGDILWLLEKLRFRLMDEIED